MDGRYLLSVEQPVVGRMMSNPKPLESIGALSGERPVVQPNSGGVKHANLLESDGRMPGIGLEQGEILVGECSNVLGKFAVVKPEVRVGKMAQSGVQRPAS